jgi:hypothetical protein
MTALLVLALFASAGVAMFAWLDHEARRGEAMRAALPDSDGSHCVVCAGLDDTLARLDMSLWAIECEGAS